MDEQKLYYYLKLLRIKGLGVRTIRKILDSVSSVEEVFSADFFEKNPTMQISKKIREQIHSLGLDDEKIIQREIAFIKKEGILPIGIKDALYSSVLRECPDAPIVLFAKGDTTCLNDRSISIVGTRKATNYGINFTKELVQNLSQYKPVITSGLAEGIDVCAHKSALENGLKTIAVFGTSFQTIYPSKHRTISEEIQRKGILLSEYPTWTVPNPKLFLQRNRIVAGLSQATVIVETPLKGGSMSTAYFSNDYSREVFALAGRYFDSNSQGCHYLIKQNSAQIITQAEDIANALNWSLKEKNESKKSTISKQKIPWETLSEKEKRVVKIIQESEKIHIDELALITTFSISELNGLLMLLEINGVVKTLPGKIFIVDEKLS